VLDDDEKRPTAIREQPFYDIADPFAPPVRHNEPQVKELLL